MDELSCSGDEGRCDRSLPRADAESVIPEPPPLIGRYFDLDGDGGRWGVFVNVRGEVEHVRCPEHRDSVL